MKTVLIATAIAIAIASLSALADTASGIAVNGDLGYSAAAPQGRAPSGSSGSVLGASAAPGLSRAQVRAELDAARRNGQLVSGELGAGALTRASTGSQAAGR